MEYILYCDESIDTDTKYGDFFGGCIISSSDLQPVVDALEKCKKENNLLQEIKWTKVTENYLQKYQNVIRLFFSFVRQGKIKVRIMFRSMENQYVSESKEDKYLCCITSFSNIALDLLTLRE
jgi:6-phosphogluconate dehydrogenase